MSNEHHQHVSEEDLKKELEHLNSEVVRLNEARVRIEERVQQAQKEAKVLSEQFIQEFGTDDIEKLDALLTQREQENLRALEAHRERVGRFAEEIAKAQAELAKLY